MVSRAAESKVSATGLNVMVFGDMFLVQPDKPEAVTQAGIIIPDAAQERHSTGVVRLKGPDVSEQIHVGDRVVWLWDAEKNLQLGKGMEFHVMTERDLACAILPCGDDRGTMLTQGDEDNGS